MDFTPEGLNIMKNLQLTDFRDARSLSLLFGFKFFSVQHESNQMVAVAISQVRFLPTLTE